MSHIRCSYSRTLQGPKVSTTVLLIQGGRRVLAGSALSFQLNTIPHSSRERCSHHPIPSMFLSTSCLSLAIGGRMRCSVTAQHGSNRCGYLGMLRGLHGASSEVGCAFNRDAEWKAISICSRCYLVLPVLLYHTRLIGLRADIETRAKLQAAPPPPHQAASPGNDGKRPERQPLLPQRLLPMCDQMLAQSRRPPALLP